MKYQGVQHWLKNIYWLKKYEFVAQIQFLCEKIIGANPHQGDKCHAMSCSAVFEENSSLILCCMSLICQ